MKKKVKNELGLCIKKCICVRIIISCCQHHSMISLGNTLTVQKNPRLVKLLKTIPEGELEKMPGGQQVRGAIRILKLLPFDAKLEAGKKARCYSEIFSARMCFAEEILEEIEKERPDFGKIEKTAFIFESYTLEGIRDYLKEQIGNIKSAKLLESAVKALKAVERKLAAGLEIHGCAWF